MMIKFVDLERQLFGDASVGSGGIITEVRAALDDVTRATSFIMGPWLEQFETAFSEFCQTTECVGLNSGTDALEFALRCNDITSGTVITVPNSYFTTASSIVHAGAQPTFVDIDPNTYNINTEQLESAIDADTRAILVVHLYGRPCDMREVLRIAGKHHLPVLEDCAHAPGARYEGRPMPFSGTGAFSFYPGKNIGAFGDAGAFVTDDREVARRTRLWRNDGRAGHQSDYRHEILGRKARLDALQAAVLSVKLKYLPSWNDQRLKHAARYNALLANVSEVQLPLLAADGVEPVFHIYNILTDHRDDLARDLTQLGIAVGIHYPVPIHLQPAFAYLGYKEGSFPIAEQVARRTLSLPMFPELRGEEIGYVCDSIKKCLSSSHRPRGSS